MFELGFNAVGRRRRLAAGSAGGNCRRLRCWASMLAVGLTNILFDYAALPMAVKVFAQAISGAFIGMQIGRKDVARMRGLIVPFLLLAVMLTVNTFVVGIAIQKLCGWDWITALLPCVAGGVTDISLIAMEMDADVGTVAMMQNSPVSRRVVVFPVLDSIRDPA